MQSILFVVLLFVSFISFVTFVQSLAAYSGTTAGAPLFAPADLSTRNCSLSSISAPYVVLNATFDTPGVREVAAILDLRLRSNILIFVYTSFDASAPCDNLLGLVKKNQFNLGGGPVLDDFIYFNDQMYFFVVTSSSNNVSGTFAMNIFDSMGYGSINASSYAWPLVRTTTFTSPRCIVASPGSSIPYSTFSWTQDQTGWFDLSAFFVNDSIAWGSTTLALYQNTFIPNTLKTPCTSLLTNGTFVAANRLNSSRGAIVPYQNLISGTTYSVVISGDRTDSYGYWGFQISATRVRFMYTSSSYIQPSRSLPCAFGSSAVPAWDSYLFAASERTYLIDTGTPPDPYTGFDAYSFLYQGVNTGNGAAAKAPITCSIFTPLLAVNDTGSIALVRRLEIGTNYTLVVSTSSTSGLAPLNSPQRYAYMLYVFTGELIGPDLGPSTTTTTTSATSATSATPNTLTSTGPTTGNISSTGAATTSTATSIQTSASACSVLFFISCIVFLLIL